MCTYGDLPEFFRYRETVASLVSVARLIFMTLTPSFNFPFYSFYLRHLGCLKKMEYSGLYEHHLQNVGIVRWILVPQYFLLHQFKLLQILFNTSLNDTHAH